MIAVRGNLLSLFAKLSAKDRRQNIFLSAFICFLIVHFYDNLHCTGTDAFNPTHVCNVVLEIFVHLPRFPLQMVSTLHIVRFRLDITKPKHDVSSDLWWSDNIESWENNQFLLGNYWFKIHVYSDTDDDFCDCESEICLFLAKLTPRYLSHAPCPARVTFIMKGQVQAASN